jgi:SOS-response transcriptional repressor LexA
MAKADKLNTSPFERSQPVTQEFFDIPLLGQVRPGDPLSASGDYNLDALVSNFQHTDRHSVTLQVLDNAMQNSGIIKGDYLTVDLRIKPKNGDIAVVKLGERYFVRRFFRQNHRIRLETAGASPSSLVIEENTPGFLLFGKVLSIFREL